MLFDLRGRGRRRTVQGIYLALAVLMGGGLVFFGVGGSGSGILNADDGSGGGGGGSPTRTFVQAEQKAQKQAAAAPRDPAGWDALAKARYRLAGVGENYDENTRSFTDKGRAVLDRAAQAWERYLALNPRTVDQSLANNMASAFVPENGALNRPPKAAEAFDVLTTARPTPANYAKYAHYAYLAGQTRTGDLAARKAIALLPKSARAQAKKQIDADKAQTLAQRSGASAQPAPSG